MLEQQFNRYLAKFNKHYTDRETYEAKFKNWERNDNYIKMTNKFADLQEREHPGSEPARAAHNKLSDLSPAEIADSGLVEDINVPDDIEREVEEQNSNDQGGRRLQDSTPAPSLDLRPLLGGVRDQGYCGSCWAFAANVAFEGAIKIQKGEDVQISDQHLVSCDIYDGGCYGGWMANAWYYQWYNGAVVAEDYPYLSG